MTSRTRVLALALLAAGATGARAAEPVGLEEILVTATKTGETVLQVTPISITAFDAAMLERAAITDVKDLVGLTPGLTVGQNSAWAQVYIRGVGTNNVFPGSDTSSTVHLDGVYLARPMMVFNDFVDAERIEVLRGPQGTLYGRNSAGGTINIVTRSPDNEVRAKASAEYGNFESVRLTGSASGPLIEDRLFAGVAMMTSNRDGYVRNLSDSSDDSRLDDDDTDALLVKLRFLVADHVDVTLAADWVSKDDTGPQDKPALVDVTGAPIPLPPGFEPTVIADAHTINSPGEHVRDVENHGVSATISADLRHGLSLKSITAYRALDAFLTTDTDYTEVPGVVSTIWEEQNQFSQELQLNGRTDRLTWVAGAFYFHEEDQLVGDINPQLAGIFVFGTPDFHALLTADVETDAYAAYAQGSYAINERLTATAGLRYSYEEKKVHQVSSLDVGGLMTIPQFDSTDHDDWKAWTPKLGLDYRIDDEIMAYVSVTRGFKSGGFNFSAQQPSFDPEFLTSYELGLKSEWLNHRLRVNLGAFYYDYSDLQVQSFVLEAGGASQVETTNAADATVKGLELEFTARPIEELDLSVGIAYLDAAYDRYDCASRAADPPGTCRDVSGNSLNNSPTWQVGLAGQWTRNIGDWGAVFVRAEFQWTDEQYFTAINDVMMSQGSYELVNARAGLNFLDTGWSVVLYGRNLGDTTYYNAAADFSPFGVTRTLNPPRTFGIQVNWRH
jgi:iron complex outermembrane receptor protein